MTDETVRRIHAACVIRSWDNDTDDRSRVVLEEAKVLISWLRRELTTARRRLARQALHLERAELDAEVMRRAAFGGQKGGAA